MSTKPYILSVDDEVLNQQIVVDLLEDDYDIGIASNGQECLDSVAERTPKLILLDINMPILNGLETCKILRADNKFKNIPIIFVSALASEKEQINGMEAGSDDYLTKPFNEEELVTMINKYIS